MHTDPQSCMGFSECLDLVLSNVGNIKIIILNYCILNISAESYDKLRILREFIIHIAR